MSMKKLKLGILASGSGTNLQAIIDACETGRIDAEVGIVVSDVPTAQALERAKKRGIPTASFDRNNFGSKREFEGAIRGTLEDHGTDLVCLAGYMRIVGRTLLEPYAGRMLNIHPALLPSFPGLEAQKQAWEYGVKIAGCTVHFVDELADHGPIIAQAAVPIAEDDTPETLRDRILVEEHRLYAEAIQMIAQDRIKIHGRRVQITKA